MAMNGKVTLVRNDQDGKCTEHTVAKGTTAKDLLYSVYGAGVDPDKYMVTVKGVPVKDIGTAKLSNGDFIVISPKNVKGN
jgi:Na+-transporting NADH:ubiquinone oxidoreductase subunit NqrA